MKKRTRRPKTLVLRTAEQRRAVASPQRLELIGLFVDREPLSVVQIAERMGRPATAIHYHVKVLEKAGLLKRAGERRSGRRPEALFLPAADIFKIDETKGGTAESAADAVKTMATAFRMAERDMKAALGDPETKSAGPYRNFVGGRMHCRLTKKDLAELNRHLRGVEKMLLRVHKTHQPSADDCFVSLTVALLPLRNREVPS